MNEKELKKICLVLAVFGLILIYISELLFAVPLYRVNEVEEHLLGEKIKVCGVLKWQRTADGGTRFLELYDNTSIDVVFFKDKAIDSFDFDNGDFVCVTGAVKKYNNRLEIIGEYNTKNSSCYL